MSRTIALFLLLAWIVPMSAVAAAGRPVVIEDLAGGPYAGDPVDVAGAFLRDHGASVGLETAVPVQHRRTTAWRGREFVHFHQTHLGLPVLGADLVLALDGHGRVVLATSTLRPAFDPAPPTPVPSVVARDAALAAVELPAAEAGEPVLAWAPAGPRLVYRIAVHSDGPPGAWRVTVDAASGAVIEVHDLSRRALGRAYEENPAVSDVIEVTLTDLAGDQTVMDGTYAVVESTVFDDGVYDEAHLAVADLDGNFLYDPDPDADDDPFVEVHAYHHVTELSHHFMDTHGHTFDAPIHVTTNYRESANGTYNNAYMTMNGSGDTMLVFGQGYVDFAYDADVIAHEFGHGLIYDLAAFGLEFIAFDEYGWNVVPDAIHEGFADYWAATYFGNSVVGEYYGGRDLENDNSCPGDLVGESHEDGKILGGAGWDLHEIVGAEAADQVVYGMLAGLSSSPSFAEVGELMIALSTELVDDGLVDGADITALQEALDERGVTRCGRSLPLTDGEIFEFDVMHMMGMTELPADMCEMAQEAGIHFPLTYQFAITTPPAEEGEVFSLDLELPMERVTGGTPSLDDLDYVVFVRKDELVTFDYDLVQTEYGFDMESPFGVGYDLVFEDMPEVIHLPGDGEGEMALENDTTYYVAMYHMNCPAVTIAWEPQITLTTEMGDDDDDDSEGDDDDNGSNLPRNEDSGDCSCEAVQSPRPFSLLVCLVPAVALALRRR
jgi:hypothetical protein